MVEGHCRQAAILVAALVLSATLAFAGEVKPGTIVVEKPWSRATPAGAKVAVGFLTVKNEGKTEDRLVSVRSTISAGAEIHEMKMQGDMMMMRPVPDGIAIPPGGSVELAPSGYHIMFTGLNAPLKQGDTFRATLTFEHAGKVEVSFEVKAMGESGSSGHGVH